MKTAGTSIEVALGRFCGPDDVVTPVNPPVEGHEPRNVGSFYNHIGAADIRRLTDPDVWRSSFKFAFERNPWDKVVSYYHWLPSRGHPVGSFEDFIAQCVREDRFPYRLPSSRALYQIDGALAVDRIGFYESLEQDLGAICKQIGIDFDGKLPRAKGGLRPAERPYTDYYTPETQAVVALYFDAEIRRFGYRFAPAAPGATPEPAQRFLAAAPRFAGLIARTKPCPCGSGVRFKDCHGGLGASQATA